MVDAKQINSRVTEFPRPTLGPRMFAVGEGGFEEGDGFVELVGGLVGVGEVVA